MRILLASSLLFVAIPLGASDKNFDIGFAYRNFDSHVFGSADEQGGMVVGLDFGGRFFRPAVGLSFTGTESRHEFALIEPFDDEASAFEVTGGFRVSKFEKSFRPYLGAGLSGTWVRVKLLQSPGVAISDRDFASGYYVNTGFVRRTRKERNVTFGVDLRYRAGRDVRILDQTGDTDFFQIGLLVGFRISG